MLVKFFKPTESKGATGALDYLLNEDGREAAPELLYGDPDITRQLLLASSFKNQYTAGCLSFAKEESDIPKSVQDELIQSFEETLLAGLEPNQYDILWIKHTDKDGRLELNFHVLNTELQTGKRLQPYLHQFDRPRIDTWKSLQNDVYELADPNAPERSRTLQLGNMKAVKPNNVKVAIHNHLEEMWMNGEINSRDEIINELNKIDGLEISRITPSAISIKVPDIKKPIRLKGELYNENIRTCQDYTKATENKQKRFDKEREQRIEANREKLDRLNQKCGEHRQKKYKYTLKAKEETKALFKAVNDDIAAYNDSVNNSKRNLRENVEELRKRVSRMQELSSNERQKAILQTIKPNNKNKERYQRGKNIRNRLRSIRANSIRNGIVKKRDDIDREKLQRFAEEIIKELLRSSRDRKIRHSQVQRYGSNRDASKANNKPLHELRERKANSRDRRSNELDF
ncbi:relaxase/mobilization nuclease domain-containing protein [Vibrio fluvialis]|nr:relaxase/mobilization nuclease domain-containing protein [Vibrio fluvialis]